LEGKGNKNTATLILTPMICWGKILMRYAKGRGKTENMTRLGKEKEKSLLTQLSYQVGRGNMRKREKKTVDSRI